MKKLFGHTSFETAYKVDDYPYGFKLRTTIFYWIETTKKKGDRFCSCTIDPRNGRINKPKKSTYYPLGVMYLDAKDHVQWTVLGPYANKEKVEAFIQPIGIENLNPDQKSMFNQMMGINEIQKDEFTGKIKKDYAVKWKKDKAGKYVEVKLTFDRPDGVSTKEIFIAMKALNQDKLNEVFEVRNYGRMGQYPGTVRVCVRGGSYLGAISQESYTDFLASDYNTIEDER
jgi:hypothetical protein